MGGQVLNLLCLNLCSHLGVETRRMETVGVVTMTGTIHLHLLETCLHGQVVKEDLLDILVLHLHHHPKDPTMEAATAGVCLHGLVFPHHLLQVNEEFCVEKKQIISDIHIIHKLHILLKSQ